MTRQGTPVNIIKTINQWQHCTFTWQDHMTITG